MGIRDTGNSKEPLRKTTVLGPRRHLRREEFEESALFRPGFSALSHLALYVSYVSRSNIRQRGLPRSPFYYTFLPWQDNPRCVTLSFIGKSIGFTFLAPVQMPRASACAIAARRHFTSNRQTVRPQNCLTTSRVEHASSRSHSTQEGGRGGAKERIWIKRFVLMDGFERKVFIHDSRPLLQYFRMDIGDLIIDRLSNSQKFRM